MGTLHRFPGYTAAHNALASHTATDEQRRAARELLDLHGIFTGDTAPDDLIWAEPGRETHRVLTAEEIAVIAPQNYRCVPINEPLPEPDVGETFNGPVALLVVWACFSLPMIAYLAVKSGFDAWVAQVLLAWGML